MQTIIVSSFNAFNSIFNLLFLTAFADLRLMCFKNGEAFLNYTGAPPDKLGVVARSKALLRARLRHF